MVSILRVGDGAVAGEPTRASRVLAAPPGTKRSRERGDARRVGRGAMSWAQSLWKQYDPINRIMFPAQGRAASYDVKGTPPSPPRRRLGPRHPHPPIVQMSLENKTDARRPP